MLSISALRHGGRAYVSGHTERFTALAVEELPTEFRGYGDPVALANLMRQVDRWACLEVESDLAEAVARSPVDDGGRRPVLRLGVLRAAPARPPVHHEAVQTLHSIDLHLLVGADPRRNSTSRNVPWTMALLSEQSLMVGSWREPPVPHAHGRTAISGSPHSRRSVARASPLRLRQTSLISFSGLR